MARAGGEAEARTHRVGEIDVERILRSVATFAQPRRSALAPNSTPSLVVHGMHDLAGLRLPIGSRPNSAHESWSPALPLDRCPSPEANRRFGQ